MLIRVLRTGPGPITAIALLGGFALMVTGNRPFAIAGAILILFALLIPFLQLPTKRDDTPERPMGVLIPTRPPTRRDPPELFPHRQSGEQPETPEPVGRQGP